MTPRQDRIEPLVAPEPADPMGFLHDLASQLVYAHVRFELAGESDCRLPLFLGSTLRGGLALAMRSVACALRNEQCPSCMLRERCHYSVLFETPPDSRLDAWQNQASWPRPIVIEPPGLRADPWRQGEILPFDIVLFGRAAHSFPYLVLAASRMATTGLGGTPPSLPAGARARPAKRGNAALYAGTGSAGTAEDRSI